MKIAQSSLPKISKWPWQSSTKKLWIFLAIFCYFSVETWTNFWGLLFVYRRNEEAFQRPQVNWTLCQYCQLERCPKTQKRNSQLGKKTLTESEIVGIRCCVIMSFVLFSDCFPDLRLAHDVFLILGKNSLLFSHWRSRKKLSDFLSLEVDTQFLRCRVCPCLCANSSERDNKNFFANTKIKRSRQKLS